MLGALLATLPGGEASDGVDARVAARAIAVAIECMGSFAAEDATFRETADALTTALRVCGESEGERGVSECAAAVRALAAAAPATAAATLRRTLETIRGGGGAAGVGAVVGAAAAAAALTAAADALELGIPAGLLLDAALVGGAVAYGPPSASFESNAAKARGWGRRRGGDSKRTRRGRRRRQLYRRRRGGVIQGVRRERVQGDGGTRRRGGRAR